MSKDDKIKFFQNQNSMNGLVNFIAEMRTCRVRELEQKRVNKELANIRSKFKDPNLNGYNKRKYVAKLLYMYILGYEIDIGQMESVNLMSATKFSEKQMGYLAVTLMLGEQPEYTKLIVSAIKRDMDDPNELNNCLALHAIANIGVKELCESLVTDIFNQFISRSKSPFVRKKAGLCLLRIFRKYPELIPGKDWANDIVKVMDDANLGVLHSATTLITALIQTYPDSYSGCVTKTIQRLYSIVVNGDYDQNYLYYKIPAPWLQVKLLRLLQYFPPRNILLILAQAPDLVNNIDKLLRIILSNSETPIKSYNQGNANTAVLIEAINYIIHLDPYSQLISTSCRILVNFLSGKEANFKYLALETMSHIAATGDPLETLQTHKDTIISFLTDKDISIRRRALDLLYSMCNQNNSRHIVDELLKYLSSDSDYEFIEELVLKVAILAEKYVSELTWYVDVILKLLTTAGDATSDTLWFRVIQIVTNQPDLREYATYTILQALKEQNCHDVTIKIAGHLLGEFGDVIVESPNCSPIEQFMALHAKFGLSPTSTRAILLSTYLKLANLFPEIKGEIVKVFESYQYALDTELQQRAFEYLSILNLPNDNLLQTVCEEMPPFPERESGLVLQLTKKIHDTQDVRTWTIGGQDAQKEVQKKAEEKIAASERPLYSSEQAAKIAQPQQKKKSVDSTEIPQAKILAPNTPYQRDIQETQVERVESAESLYNNLLISSSGLLYEDSKIQIGVKSEYLNNLGRVAIFFGNKTNETLTDFKVKTETNQDLDIKIIEQIATVIPPAVQLHILFGVEAKNIPSVIPKLKTEFMIKGQPFNFNLDIPIQILKFIGPCEMGFEDFISRWKQIGGPPKEAQTVFQPPTGINLEFCKKAFRGLNFSILPNVDSNPLNIVCSGIFSCTNIGKVGCLLRLESNSEHQMYRLTIRTTNEGVSAGISLQLMAILNN